MTRFSDYKRSAATWITLANGDYYPDILVDAVKLYGPILEIFRQLVETSESSARLLLGICEVGNQWTRVQLARVFRKYVSPRTPVEMLKKKTFGEQICRDFGRHFRPIQEVQAALKSRPFPDEAICAVLWEYRERGQKGYDLTERFFAMFRELFPDLEIEGPERAGRDIFMGEVFEGYPRPRRPVDFVVRKSGQVLAVGLARYDSDRGGAQEDDRTGGYHNCVDEILRFARRRKLPLKVILLNDGPGLLLGSMWDDYAVLERSHPGRVMVLTLRMVPERLSREWMTQ
jgi:hypothetical protein